MFEGSHGIELIKRYAAGEHLDAEETDAMKATMYLIMISHTPRRDRKHFQWNSPEHFMHEIWPNVQTWSNIQNGLFGHGAVSP